MNATALAREIETRREAHYAGLAQRSRRSLPRLSDINDCLRHDWLSIVHWDKTPDTPPWLMARFAAGNDHHALVKAELLRLGFDLRGEECDYTLKGRRGQVIATGHIDGLMRDRERPGDPLIPYEIKSAAIGLFNQIGNGEMLDAKSPFIRKWGRQMQGYLLCTAREQGLFVVTNGLGAWKLVPTTLDYEHGEWLMTHLEEVAEHVAADLPPPYHGDRTCCATCPWFRGLCQPDSVAADGVVVWADDEAEELVAAYLRTEAAADEFARAEKRIKERARADADGKGLQILAGGRAVVSVRQSETTSYDVPKDIKEKYARKAPRTLVSVTEIGA